MIQFINAAVDQEYSMFYEYGQITLTVFGFTLIGGIFENRKKHPKIVKQLFDSSLSFLIASISFFFMYSLSSILTKPTETIGEILSGPEVGLQQHGHSHSSRSYDLASIGARTAS